jgi:hypothetical protein
MSLICDFATVSSFYSQKICRKLCISVSAWLPKTIDAAFAFFRGRPHNGALRADENNGTLPFH